MQRARFTSVADAGAFERETPARAADLRSDVLVPLCQAGISGLIAGALWAGGAWLLGADFWLVFVASAGIFGGCAWFILLRDHRRGLWARERREARDLDGDGVVGEPSRPVLVNPYQGQRARDADKHATELAALADFLYGCEGDTSLRTWEPRIGRDQYTAWRDALVSSGWASWRQPGNERAGWELSAPADEVVAAIAGGA